MKSSAVQLLLREAGMQQIASSRAPLFSSSSKEVLRCFAPQIQERPYGVILLGTIGILVPEFEKTWISEGGKAGAMDLTMFITNAEDLRDPPPLIGPNARATGLDWIKKIMNCMEELPDSYAKTLSLLDSTGPIVRHRGLVLITGGSKSDRLRIWLRAVLGSKGEVKDSR